MMPETQLATRNYQGLELIKSSMTDEHIYKWKRSFLMLILFLHTILQFILVKTYLEMAY